MSEKEKRNRKKRKRNRKVTLGTVQQAPDGPRPRPKRFFSIYYLVFILFFSYNSFFSF